MKSLRWVGLGLVCLFTCVVLASAQDDGPYVLPPQPAQMPSIDTPDALNTLDLSEPTYSPIEIQSPLSLRTVAPPLRPAN
jgi:hypothetical protein